ncbi:MAG: hypothetical protein E7580_00425 [Ruminococcaceae bacterium]|nr:hypothetical protein [Oscillospiraceae bacterium]
MRKHFISLFALCLALLLVSCTVPAEDTASAKNNPLSDPLISAPKVESLASVPAFDSSCAFVIIGDNSPTFTQEEITEKSFEAYSSLDALGRCGTAFACIGKDLMPTEERGSIGQVKPSGWQTVKYDIVDGKYLYNRCHLIGFQLTGENANERNLITGTRYMNVEGMLPFENMVADYIRETGNHVMYRVTPVYTGENLLCDGVLMEAYSVEDKGEGIAFFVYCYNAQPGIEIDYTNGDSKLSAEKNSSNGEKGKFVLNVNTKKIHKPDCSSVKDMSSKNRQDYEGSLDPILAQGFEKCKSCF